MGTAGTPGTALKYKAIRVPVLFLLFPVETGTLERFEVDSETLATPATVATALDYQRFSRRQFHFSKVATDEKWRQREQLDAVHQ